MAGADSRWTLTDEERKWASDLKQALADASVPPPATDFELAHFAIISKGNVQKGVKRVTNYNKHVKPEYTYTPEEAAAAIGFMNRKWPGCLLACGTDPTVT